MLSPPTSCQYPYDNLLLWMGLLLDVHFTSLLLDTTCRGLLLDLRACVLSQVRGVTCERVWHMYHVNHD